jgi:glycosyltransferase involved in cell wall biosynthesis
MWLCTPLGRHGGTITHLHAWARELRATEFGLHLVYAGDREGVEARFADLPSVRLTHLPALRRGLLPALPRLVGLLREVRPAVLHTVFIQSDILGALAARLAGGPPVVSSLEGYLVPARARWWKKAAYAVAYGLATPGIERVVAISEATAREVGRDFRVPPAKMTVIHSGVDAAAIVADASVRRTGPYVVGALGRFEAQKGFDRFLHAATSVAESVPDARFEIAGDGEERDNLIRLAHRLGLADRVRFAGWVADSFAFLDGLDVLVFPSLPREGMPWVVLEALARGVPVVATRVGGIPEVVRDGVEGLLVPPGDSEAIARAVTALLTDRDLAGRLARAGLRRVARFTIAREVEQFARLYRAVMRTAAPAESEATACASSS